MLNQIHIKNFTIIDNLELDLSSGMTVVTGETGAGKSVMIDAIEYALGKRASSDVIKHNCDKADICIAFDITQNKLVKEFLKSNDFDDENNCLIRRLIYQDGRSKSYINNIPTTLQPLRELSDLLINIHGQHEFHSLLKRDIQRDMLDTYGKHDDLLKKVKNYYHEWVQLHQQLKTLRNAKNHANERIDFLQFQLKELNDLALKEHELEELDQEHKQLAHADTLLSNTQLAQQALSEDENNIAVINNLNKALQALASIKSFDPHLNNIAELIQNALIQTEEASNELKHYLDMLDLNPARLSELEQRLSAIHDIARKHRIKPEALFSFRREMEQELNELENSETHLETLENNLKEIEKNYFQAAKKLSAKRKETAEKLSQLVTQNMQPLGMSGGQFTIEFEPVENISPDGNERITFMVTANPGQPLYPLSKVASGGELSRISLAIQVITAQNHITPTLVFDEVDVGIGGPTAEVVGQLLKNLGNNAQVICITHLAQVAANGHQHLQVKKINQKNSVKIDSHYLYHDDRIREIARMIGGIKITETSLAHAKEMLSL